MEANDFISKVSNMTNGKASNILNIASYRRSDNVHRYYNVLCSICTQYNIPDSNIHIHPTTFTNSVKHTDYMFDIVNGPNIDGLVFPILGTRPKLNGRVNKISGTRVSTTYKLTIGR